MENIETIEMMLSKEENQNIEKKKQSKALSIIIIIVSILLAIIPICGLTHGKYANMGIYMTAVVLLIIGIVFLFIALNEYAYYYIPTGKKLKHDRIFMNNSDIATMKQSILENKEPDFSKLSNDVTSGHYLDIMGTGDGTYYLIQTVEYIPYDYRATTPVFTCQGNCATALHNLLHK